MEPFDKAEHVQATQAFVATLDGHDLAAKLNAANGSALRKRDALNMATLVCLAALRHRGRAIRVAGLGAQWNEGTMVLFIGADYAETEMTP